MKKMEELSKKRLYRSSNQKMILGVCSGIGEYLEIDPTIVRLGFAILCAAGGSGILAYIVAAVIMPEDPQGYITSEN